MCGITGVLNLTNRTPIDKDGVRLANESMFHRGPDDEGMLLEPNFGMAMRRLSMQRLLSALMGILCRRQARPWPKPGCTKDGTRKERIITALSRAGSKNSNGCGHPHVHALVPAGIIKQGVFHELRSISSPVIAGLFRARLHKVLLDEGVIGSRMNELHNVPLVSPRKPADANQ